MIENNVKNRKLSRFDRIAVYITNIVGTVWCAIIFAIIALIGLPYEINGGTPAVITWLTQTFLQLVLMSIILVGQNIQTKHNELKAERDLETDLAIKKELEALTKQINKIESDEARKIDQILKLLESKN